MDQPLFWTWVAVVLQFFAAGAAMMWPEHKWIGFIIMAIGVVIALIVGIVYASTNFPERYAETKRVFFLFPIGVAIGLLVAWMVFHWHPGERQELAADVALRLQFTDSHSVPKQISDTNVRSWYAVYTASTEVSFEDINKNKVGQVAVPPHWNIFIIFERPAVYTQMLTVCTGPNNPKCAVQTNNREWAIVTIDGDVSFANLEVSVTH